jgi:hypothetical protein
MRLYSIVSLSLLSMSKICQATGMVRVPIRFDELGRPEVSGTVDGNNITLRIGTGSVSHVLYPQAVDGHVPELRIGDFAMRSVRAMYAVDRSGENYPSHLEIGRGSDILNEVESIAVIKNGVNLDEGEMVLRSTLESFTQSCMTNSTHRFDLNDHGFLEARFVLSNEAIAASTATFQVQLSRSSPATLVVLPRTFGTGILAEMIRLGATRDDPEGWIMSNCSNELVAQLPEILIQIGDHAIQIFPDEYVVAKADNICELRFRYQADSRYTPAAYTLNPLLLSDTNVLFTSDGRVYFGTTAL